MGAVFVAAFVDRDFGAYFPEEQGFSAIGAEVLGRMFESEIKLEGIGADFTFKLGSFFAIVKVNKRMGSLTMGAAHGFRDTVFLVSIPDGF